MSEEDQNRAAIEAEKERTSNDDNYRDEEDEKDDETRAAEEKATREAARKRCYKFSDPPKVYTDVKPEVALKDLHQLVASHISEQEIVYLSELKDYVTDKSGSWSVGDEHLTMLAGFLANKDNTFAPNVPLLTLQILRASAVKDDFVLILHQDRKEHRIMSYINLMEQLTLAEQEETVKFLCNMCGVPGSFDWLMYISEWTDYDGSVTSNSRVTTKAAVHAILNDKLSTLQEVGMNLMFNMSLKNVFDDVASELSTAILQYLHTDITVEHARLCLIALSRFLDINTTDIAALTKMLGPDLSKFNGKSKEIDELVSKIQSKLPNV